MDNDIIIEAVDNEISITALENNINISQIENNIEINEVTPSVEISSVTPVLSLIFNERGAKGDNGSDATINGVTTLNIVEGNDTILTQVDDTLTIGVSETPTFDSVKYNTLQELETPIVEGETRWNSTDGTLDLGMGDITQQIGQELFIKAHNRTGATIPNGTPVYIDGRQGNRPKIWLAKSDSESTSAVIGVTTQDIENLHDGFVTTFGYVRQIKTNYSGWNEGDKLYVSKTTAGLLTNVEPAVPHHSDVVGQVAVLGAEGIGSIFVNISKHFTLEELTDVDGTPLTADGQIPVWNETNKYFDFDKNINDYKTFSGFENRTDSTISIDSSGVFTIAPTTTSYDVYTNGTGKHVITLPQTVNVVEDQTISYIYIDNTGTLQISTSAWNLASGNDAPCSIVFKDGTNYALTDERHSYERNKSWHNWAHFNIGAMYQSGLGGTFTNTTLSITQGVIFDEDIKFDTLTTKTATTHWYRNATTGMRMVRNRTTPYSQGTFLQYDNGSGTLQPVDNNKYATNWIYCSNDATEPIYTVISQAQYTTLAQAQNASLPAINLSTAEWKLLYRVIYQRTTGGTVYVEASDFRTVQTGTASSQVAPTSHNNLTNRDASGSHPATAITYGATTVDGALATLIANNTGTNTGNETTTTIGALINGATAKTTPADADMFALMDSAGSNVVKKLSWANIKAMLTRRTPRVFSTTSATSVTPEISTYDIWTYTALAADFTINNHSTSTPTDGEVMTFRFLDNGTARQLYYGTNYVAKAGIPLPLTTVISKNLTMAFSWNSNLSKWNLLAVGLED